jgi:hypothetical protein
MINLHWWLLPLGILLDLIWVLWMSAVQKDWPLRSGFWGMATVAVGLFATVDIVDDHIQCIPYLMGSFIGSVVGVYIKRHVNQKENREASKTN